ncbi:amino acid adenylation domain-containing protein [Tahibacter sp. UC22_41]|uniref:non-ribosomal peptide synthetase n=1 Tax=Tahibacter sp. UC22_41 TaxID=3350178 RepID=UPI0036DB6D6C
MSDIVERLARLSPQQRNALLRVIDTDGQRFGIAPLSHAQQRLWLIDRFDPGNAAWHVSGVREIEGDLDAAALQAAIADLVGRHAALRTAFHVVDGVPIQSLATAPAPTLVRLDLTDRPEAEREAAAIAHGCAFSDAPFDLARPPLLRASLIRLAPRRHWLVLAIHHIACDMVSLGVLQHELIALYDAHRRGEAPLLPTATHSYTDFARAQREPAARAAHDASIARWTQRLAGAPAQLDLPTDLPRRAAQGSRGGAMPFTIDAATNAALREAAQAAGATPVMAHLAIYAALLGKLAGQDDVVVGSPVSNRSHTRWNGIVGFFLNTLLLRIDLSGAPDFRELLRRTRETCIAAYADADAPFERLVDALQPGRPISHRPLFQALFVHQNRPPAQEIAAGLTWSHVDLPLRTMVADVGLWTVEAPGACEGFVAYDADLILPSTAQRFGERYVGLAGELLRAPSRSVHRLSPLPRAEREQIAAWTAGPQRDDDDLCLHELVAAQVRRTPDACAIVGDEGELTYRELDARARALAAQLTARGTGPDRRVAVMLERSHALVVALVAVLYAGGAYVPLDPSYPAERLRYMLEDSGAAVLLSDARAHEALGVAAVPALLAPSAGTIWQPVGAASAETTPATGTVTPDHLAYVIYTSGSTGRPKGAMNAHRAVVNRLRWMQHDYGVDASDRILQKTPSSFDVSVWEFFLPLICGATLVLARPEGHKDPAYLAALIARERVTTAHFVPSMFAAFLDRPELESLTSLRRVFLSGEALPRELAQRFTARSRAGLHNLYGPTEAAVDVSAWDCADDECGPVPIGRPVANTTLHVLDRDLAPAPVGVPGELYIGGVQVGRGYLGRAALTAERFVPDPSGPPGARLYRTGDRARWRHDGALDYLGRNDHQVKIRGFRIEPGEIDDALAQCRDVERAAVVARTATSGESLLVAYVQPRRDAATDRAHAPAVVRDWAAVHDEMHAVAAADPTFDTSIRNSSDDDGPIPGSTLSPRPAADGPVDRTDAVFLPPHGGDEIAPVVDEPATPVETWSNDPLRASIVDALTRRLTDALRAQLPAHMVPDRFVFLDRLPLSPSGKIDRLALPPLDGAAPARTEPPLAPRDDVERRLAAIWRELLGVETVGVRDDFFALGGQSILAARLMARIQGEFDRALPLALLFEGATIEFLAQRLADGERAPGRALVPIRPRGPDDTLTPFFCIHAGGGNVIAYQALAEAMATSSPRAFYALQAIGIDGTQPPLEGFGAMAERYIEEIRSVQPHGPYLIGGWCTGGRLAQEIVRRLEAAGEAVSVLALLDAIATPLGMPDGEALDDAGLLASMSPAFAAAAASVEAGPKSEWLARLVTRLRDDGAIPPEARVEQIRDMLVVFRAILRAERSHRPQPCAAPIVQFRALEQPSAWLAHDLGWRRFARGGVSVVDVPGNHLSMMEIRSNVDALARALNAVLDAPAQVVRPGFAAVLRDRFLTFVLALRARFDPRLR